MVIHIKIILFLFCTLEGSFGNLILSGGGGGIFNDTLKIVEIPLGKLKSNILQSRDRRDYYAFYKVPYAQPPIGELRFKVRKLTTIEN
jgi:carboxylesterase family protein